jgi:hypothetical protein
MNDQKIAASPYVTQDCKQVGHGSNSGIEVFGNWRIGGILSVLIY